MEKKEIQYLEAENARLKRIMKRMHEGFWGIPSVQGIKVSSSYLPLHISSILSSTLEFNEKINETLEAIGEFADVSRIYIFENKSNTNLFSNTFEWCTQGVQPEIHNLKDLSYNDFEEWRRMLTQDGLIKASHIKDLPQEVQSTLAAQGIESILVYPLIVKDQYYGFIGFDECSYNREWLPHETDLLLIASRLIAHAYENYENKVELRKHSQLQGLMLEVSRLFNSKASFEFQVKEALTKLTSFFESEHAFLYENFNNNTHCKSVFEYSPNTSGIELNKNTVKSYDTDLKGWLDSINANGFYKSNATENDNESCSIIAIPVRLESHFWGLVGFKNCSSKFEWSESHETALITIADMISNAYERSKANSEIRDNHAEILKINQKLAGKEQFLQGILSAVPIGIMLINNRRIEFVSKAVLDHSGYVEEELIGQNVKDYYFDKNGHDELIEKFYNDIRTSGVAQMESHLKCKNGEGIIMRIIGTPAPSEDNNGDSILIIGEDITHVKTTESHLEESEERNRRIIEATIDGILIADKDLNIVYANTAACGMLNYESTELGHKAMEAVFPKQVFQNDILSIIKNIQEGQDYKGDSQLIDKNGETIHAEIYATALNLNGNLHYYFSVHNITRRKNNEQKLRTLTENSPDHIIRVGSNETISYCNSSFLNEFGLQTQNCVGKSFLQIDELPQVLSQGISKNIKDAIETGTERNVELEFRYKNQPLVFDWKITPEINGSSQISSLLIIGRNFTQKKKSEQELLIAKEKAESADRLKSAFLANMSHEIRTPLNAIVGFTNLLKEENISEVEKIEYIDIVNKSSENLMELINDIVDLAKIESGELRLADEDCNVAKLLRELHLLYEKRMAIDPTAHLKFYLNIPETDQVDTIICDTRRIRQVFINLLGNAFKFTSKGFIEFGYTKEDDSIRFYVRDTGIGIKAEKQAVVFEPFRQADESTSKNYGGTGLGLSICKRLVSAHGGTMGLNSEPETGSEFYFTLPLQKTKTNGVPIKKIEKTKVITPANYTWVNKMMLLIDATSTAQLQMRKVLDRTKITLMSARTQKSARELLLKRNDIHIVLIDLEMPGLALDSFIPEIRQMGIYVPFIGQTSKRLTLQEKDSLINLGFSHIFEKPVNNDELLHAFNGLLNGEKVH